jgi:hypothetical protein
MPGSGRFNIRPPFFSLRAFCASDHYIRILSSNQESGGFMPKYLIEREIAGAGKLTPEQLQGISQKSCGVLEKLGPKIQWVESYLTDDKIYCVYIAPDEAMVREHARLGGFPANRVSEIKRMIDPTTATA